MLGDRASAMAQRLPAAPTDLGQWQRRRLQVRENLASLGGITMRDWADHVATAAGSFDRVMPYVQGMLKQTDLQYHYASLAPRPLLLLDGTDRAHWPASGFKRVQQTDRQTGL